MVTIKANTLEEAYEKAAKELGVSKQDLEIVVVQHPSSGILGFFSKPAIVVAGVKTDTGIKTKKTGSRQEDTTKPMQSEAQESLTVSHSERKDSSKKESAQTFDEPLDDEAIARKIESELAELLIEKSCFDIDVVEVDVADNTALIFIDGEDAPLLIGKEGYRYNALSYMLFNWIHAKYGLFVKLEIAQFLTMQQEMIRNLLSPLIEEIRQAGRGRTRVLDGILVQIALEQLREAFPDKYVAIKTDKDGGRYVLVNDFNKKYHG